MGTFPGQEAQSNSDPLFFILQSNTQFLTFRCLCQQFPNIVLIKNDQIKCGLAGKMLYVVSKVFLAWRKGVGLGVMYLPPHTVILFLLFLIFWPHILSSISISIITPPLLPFFLLKQVSKHHYPGIMITSMTIIYTNGWHLPSISLGTGPTCLHLVLTPIVIKWP